MIFFNGCSFTFGEKYRVEIKNFETEYEEVTQHRGRYSVALTSKFKMEEFNISCSGKCNKSIVDETITYLLWALSPDSEYEIPSKIILQTTDFYRTYVPAPGFHTHHRINDLEGQLSWAGKYRKLMIHAAMKQHMEYYGSPTESTALTTQYINPHTNQISVDRRTCGDHTGTHMRFEFAKSFLHLQQICESNDIPLVIMNYYPIGKDFFEDPLFKLINLDNWLLEDPFETGLYEHLEHECCTKCEDNYHWESDAHAYQADILEDFIKNRTKTKVRTDIRMNTEEIIYDYT